MRILLTTDTYLPVVSGVTTVVHSLGQEFESRAVSIAKSVERISNAAEELKELGIGGTAVGTGITAHPEFHKMMVRNLSRLLNIDFKTSNNLIELTQNYNCFVSFSGALKMLAIDLFRISNNYIIIYEKSCYARYIILAKRPLFSSCYLASAVS